MKRPGTIIRLAGGLAAMWGLSSALPALGSYVFIDYYAGPTTAASTPANVWTPAMWLWNGLNASGAGAGVVNVLNGGMNAWRITDSLPSSLNPAYVTELLPQAAGDAVRDGWRLATTARYVSDLGGGANLGLSAYIGGRAYHLMLDLAADGALQATLHDEAPRVLRLTPGDATATAFHRFQLQGSPGTANVALLFDGAVVESQWNGIPIVHATTVQWGNSAQAGGGRGVMEYQEVSLEIGPFIAGDFDNNNVVDGRDFLYWQRSLGASYDRLADGNSDGRVDQADLDLWRRNYGRAAASTGAQVPEPASAVLAVIAAVLFCRRRRRMAC